MVFVAPGLVFVAENLAVVAPDFDFVALDLDFVVSGSWGARSRHGCGENLSLKQ
jgi:hypothetical protein